MKSTNEIREFYDNYQFKFRHNVRHYMIINKLMDCGLKDNYNVLEIGCGNGALTKLILKKINNGKITALDISPVSISHAKINLKNYENVSYVVSDMSDFSSPEKFDTIVLSDVLEHIPIDQHNNLFKKLNNLLSERGFIFINIPEPKLLEWMAIKEPQNLQVIDQPLHSDALMNIAYQNGLYLKEIKSYSIYKKQTDAQYIHFVKRDVKVDYVPLPQWKIIVKKYKHYLLNMLR